MNDQWIELNNFSIVDRNRLVHIFTRSSHPLESDDDDDGDNIDGNCVVSTLPLIWNHLTNDSESKIEAEEGVFIRAFAETTNRMSVLMCQCIAFVWFSAVECQTLSRPHIFFLFVDVECCCCALISSIRNGWRITYSKQSDSVSVQFAKSFEIDRIAFQNWYFPYFFFCLQADLNDAINSDFKSDIFRSNHHQRHEITVTPHHSATIKNQNSECFLATKMRITTLDGDDVDTTSSSSSSSPAAMTGTTIPQLSSPMPPSSMDPRKHHHHSNHLNHTEELRSINIHYEKSFLLLDGREDLRVNTPELFAKRLGCPIDTKMKVVAIFGNTGDGKSHTMNHIFFGGEEIFSTSASQDSCTLGVWAAFQPTQGILCLDTEGLLGATTNENQRMRLLLKVLAISDIAIFRTRSERLHSDMFTFLGTASKAFYRHFSVALQSFGLPGPATSLGPAVIVFHETRNTKIINSSKCSQLQFNRLDAFKSDILSLSLSPFQLSIKVLQTYCANDSRKWTLT